MFDRIRTLFAAPTKPHAQSTRLSLQTLESREVPANLYWLGYSSDFTDPANWGGAIPSSADHLYFTGPTSPPPSPPPPGMPPPPPVPPSGSNTSTTFVKGPINPPIPYAPTSLPDNYAGVHILNNYSGTLTIPFNISFGAYEQTSGNTYTPGTDVTVTSTFSWTGGNVNTSSTAGEYRIQGVPLGTVNPNGGTVSSGSTMRIEPNPTSLIGSVVTFLAGTIDWLGGEGIIVDRFSIADIKPAPGAVVTFDAKTSGKEIQILENGTATIHALDRPSGNTQLAQFDGVNYSVENTGGTFKVHDRTNAKLTGGVAYLGVGGQPAFVAVKQTSGLTQLEAASKITTNADSGVLFEGGTFEVLNIDNVNLVQPEAVIDGAVLFGGTATLTMSGTKYGVLSISKYMKWSGGEIKMAIGKKPDGSVVSDLIAVVGKVTISSNPKLTVRWTNEVPGMAKNVSWDLITSADEITGNFVAQFPGAALPLEFDSGITVDKKKLFVRKTSDPS